MHRPDSGPNGKTGDEHTGSILSSPINVVTRLQTHQPAHRSLLFDILETLHWLFHRVGVLRKENNHLVDIPHQNAADIKSRDLQRQRRSIVDRALDLSLVDALPLQALTWEANSRSIPGHSRRPPASGDTPGRAAIIYHGESSEGQGSVVITWPPGRRVS